MAAAAAASATSDDDASTCFICLEPHSGPGSSQHLLHVGCCTCRGGSGFGHATCIAKAAQETNEWMWAECPTCKQMRSGQMALGLARARVTSLTSQPEVAPPAKRRRRANKSRVPRGESKPAIRMHACPHPGCDVVLGYSLLPAHWNVCPHRPWSPPAKSVSNDNDDDSTESDSDDSDGDHSESDSNGNIEEQPATAAAATPTLTTAAE